MTAAFSLQGIRGKILVTKSRQDVTLKGEANTLDINPSPPRFPLNEESLPPADLNMATSQIMKEIEAVIGPPKSCCYCWD